jgi:NAD(P)-dependent dehydrogenase (short-subunit alcohol dehydrogenase family)
VKVNAPTGVRVLVTAGGAGIGRATALRFADDGARVLVCDIDSQALDALVGERREVSAVHADVAREDSVAELFAEVRRQLGGLDVLVNAAGTQGPTGPIEALEYEPWRQCVEVNLHSAFLCMRAALPGMKQQRGGAIVNLSSTAGLYGYGLRSAYCAAKWGLIGLTRTAAIEAGPFGVRVNAICPGSVEGPRMDRVIAAEASGKGLTEDQVRQAYVAGTSLGVFVTAEDVAATIAFLCSPAGARISGQAIAVDGHTETF